MLVIIFFSLCHVKAYEAVIDPIIVLPFPGSFGPKHIPDAANFSNDPPVGLK